MPKGTEVATRNTEAVGALASAFRPQGQMQLATLGAGSAAALYSMEHFDAIGQMAAKFCASGLYGDMTPAQAFIKLQTGLELGIPPTVAMDMIHLIKGKKAMAAQLMIYLINRAGHKFEILESTAQSATVRVTRSNGVVHTATFTLADAQKAGLAGKDVWRNYSDVMCLNRASSKCIRYIAPEVLGGLVHAPEDFDAVVLDGQLIGAPDVQPLRPALGNSEPAAPSMEDGHDHFPEFDALCQRIRAVRSEAKANADIAKWKEKFDAEPTGKCIAAMTAWVSAVEEKATTAKPKAEPVQPPPAEPAPAAVASEPDPRENLWLDIKATLAVQGKAPFEIEGEVADLKDKWAALHPDDQIDHMSRWLVDANGGK